MAQEAQYPKNKDVQLYQIPELKKEREGNPLMTLVPSQIPSVRMQELETQNTLVVKVIFKKFQLLLVNIQLNSTIKTRIHGRLSNTLQNEQVEILQIIYFSLFLFLNYIKYDSIKR
ncbi:unnamed protein product [Paramecium octaurelia]|uniref:Uncharacterized protein n=1 Tax=Paramecium octaurelia TaxID=43137 RepID=A0A8S1S641_PAROT|nr:unnamed protein product [Paramecium octaurelia]